jgi:predicted outer membrane repeat protein
MLTSPRAARLLVVALVAVIAGTGSLAGAPGAEAGGADYYVTNGGNAGPGTFRAAINAIEADEPSGEQTIQLDFRLEVVLTNDVVYGGENDLLILGSLGTIDGQGQHQVLRASEPVDVTLRNLTVRGGDSDADGGALDVPDGSVEADEVVFVDNHADGDGGAVHADSVRTDLTTFSGNTASGDGGAVDTTSSGHERSTFSGNQAGGAGGAVSADFDATFEDVTLASNSSPSGAHVATTELDVWSTVFADGTGSSACGPLEDPTEDETSYEEGGTSCDLSDPTSVESGADPQLGPLTDVGFGVLSHLPAASSPLVDHYAGPCTSEYDQREAPRPQDGDEDGASACDVGAVERRDSTFTDVHDGHPFFLEVEWMAEHEISEGYLPGPAYRPSDPVSRQAMSAFLYRLAGEPAFADPTTATFADVSPSNPFFTEVEWMAAEGISTGYPGSPKPTYRPSAVVSRQAMSAFLYRYSTDLFVPPGTPTFTDVGTGHHFFLEIEWMADERISTGYLPGPEYRPSSAVSRQAMSAFLYRLD